MLKSKITYRDFEKHCAAVKKSTPVDLVEKPEVKLARIQRGKSDYKYFFEHYFPHYATAPCAKFHVKLAKAIKAKKNFRGLFRAFRGAAKSVHTNIGIPMWLKADEELMCMILVSDNETKACRLLAGLQAELSSNQRYIADFGEQEGHGTWEEGEFATKDGCGFFAIGLGQSPNGTRNMANRPDYIVVDDADTKKRCKNPMLVREAVEWITDDLIGTFDIGRERFICCNNLISKISIMGTLHTRMVLDKPEDKQWWDMQINALDKKGEPTWPEKYTKEYWAEKRGDLTMRSWELNYMNNPIESGKVFSEKWIKWGAMLPHNAYERVIIYIDPSFKNTENSDYKAVKTWGLKGRELHLINSFVRQCSIATMVAYCYDEWLRLGDNANAAIYMESNFLQDMIFDAFADEGDTRGWQLPIRGDSRKKPDKYSRMEAMSPMYERGFIVYNQDKKHDPDFATAIEQLLALEPGSKAADDSPDADEGAWWFLLRMSRARSVEAVIGMRESPTGW